MSDLVEDADDALFERAVTDKQHVVPFFLIVKLNLSTIGRQMFLGYVRERHSRKVLHSIVHILRYRVSYFIWSSFKHYSNI